jgi:hypothetical protein
MLIVVNLNVVMLIVVMLIVVMLECCGASGLTLAILFQIL